MSTALQLTNSLPAAAEKQLDLHKKNIRIYSAGVARSGAQMFGYAFLAGNEINKVADIIPHGKLLPWIEQNFPDISERTARNWRQFADDLMPKFATVANSKSATVADSPTVGLLTSPAKAKKKFSEKECSLITEAVNNALDGKGMMQFMRDCKLLREPIAPTHHPRKEKKISDEEAIRIAREQATEDSAVMGHAIDSSHLNFGLCDDKEIMAQIAVLQIAIEARRKWLGLPKPRDFAIIEHFLKQQ